MANDYLTTETGDKDIDKEIGVCRATILEHRKRAIRSAVMMLIFFGFFVFLWGLFTESRMKPATEGWNLSGAAAYAGFSILFTAFCALGGFLFTGVMLVKLLRLSIAYLTCFAPGLLQKGPRQPHSRRKFASH